MTPKTHDTPRRVLTMTRELFTAWIVAWGAATFLSAAIVIGRPVLDDLAGYAGRVFSVADDVPPLAKLAFGATLLVLTLMVRSASDRVRMGPWIGFVIVPVAFVLAVWVYPLGYYAHLSARPALFMHLPVVALAGAAYLRPFAKASANGHRSSRKRVSRE